jgi:carbamoyl-phosphate synthase large subunit
LLQRKGYEIYATHGTHKFLIENEIENTDVLWADEDGEMNALKLISEKRIDLVINIPKDNSRRELENDYSIRRAAIDFNIPLLTNARLAGAFITAFCTMTADNIKIKSWQEY